MAAAPSPRVLQMAKEAADGASPSYLRGSRPELGYGTAGFRTKGDVLDHVLYRMGLLAALRSKVLGGKAVGIMVTASHNPECDNGAKLVEPLGDMLVLDWEAHATKLANAPDDGLADVLAEIAAAVGADPEVPATVIVGRDTRASSVRLTLAACDGVGALRPSLVRSIGLATTPQLHYVVRCENTAGAYGVPSALGYADKLVSAFERLVAAAPADNGRYTRRLIVDCANGVGAVALQTMRERLHRAGLEIELRNVGEGVLNEGCGADFVKIKQTGPSGVDTSGSVRCASLDGDADRLVYFFEEGGHFRLLDGDRIALLIANYAATLLREAGIEDVQLGLVQTAYANGGSTDRAVASLGAENVKCAKTGVKHCHHVAVSMDVGIYFEANGHGTALFSERFVERVSAVVSGGSGAQAATAQRLLMIRDVINEAVGDAVSNLLAVEAVLRITGWSCSDWLAMYPDLPNRQVKVVVKDRSIFETTNAERTCVKPEGLQAAVDALVKTAPRGRAFVRPSGTEDVVRVYAEAETLEATLALAQAVSDAVYNLGGGVGEKPKVS